MSQEDKIIQLLTEILSKLNANDQETTTTDPSNQQGQKRGRRIEPDALAILKAITGRPSSDVCKWLYKAEIIDKTNEIHPIIMQYITNSQDHPFGIKVEIILRITLDKDYDFKDDGTFRMMVWHGNKKTNIASILQKGFAIPTNKNLSFGSGVYFSDRASKSAKYCDSVSPGAVGHLFLCDVDLGNMFKVKSLHKNYQSPPNNYDTVKCSGKFKPDWKENKTIGGSIFPVGPTIRNSRFQSYPINYSEYVVYDSKRIKPKYLVIVKFQSTKCV